jgi:hypothetical protein
LAQTSLQKDDTDNETILVEEDSNDEVWLPIIGGLEPGIYLFFANGLQILGLETVPADRVRFLVQVTTVIVPVVSAAFTGNLLMILMQMWPACLLVFCGVIIIGLDGKDALFNDRILSSRSSTLPLHRLICWLHWQPLCIQNMWCAWESMQK